MLNSCKLPITLLMLAGVVNAETRTGLQPVGFGAFSSADVTKTVEIFRSCPAKQSCELAFLAYSFGGFGNPRTFIQAALPTMTSNQKLVITIYLDDGANRDDRSAWCWFRRNVSATAFWDAVRRNDATLANDWKTQMAKPAGDFIREMEAWASGRNLRSRLSFVVVPVLEDGGPSGADPAGASGYQRLLGWTQSQMPADVTYRRSSTAQNAERLPALEFHLSAVPGTFRAGDVITGDGVNNGAGVADSAWKRVQADAIARGGSALWWINVFNNNQAAARTQPPWGRGVLKPFTNDPDLVTRGKAMLGARR